MVAALMVAMLALPAAANHDHQLHNPGGCTTIPVSHQDHSAGAPGRKFHGAAHIGSETKLVGGKYVLGKGNSVVHVAGGACP